MKHATIAAVAAVGMLGLGLGSFEQDLITMVRNESPPNFGMAAHAAPSPASSAPLRSVLGARDWLNTPPLRAEDLRGKVVLVNFWTYSCINCLRTLPYLRAWADKYRDRGLVVVGVHTPEFAFEKDLANVRKALVALGIGYPVAIDSDFAIWRAFDNQAWPGFYFIGADGRVRQHVFGEGDYDQSERLIQKLLSEAKAAGVPGDLVAVKGTGPQAAPDEKDLGSPETYVGYNQGTNFASPGGVRKNVANRYDPAPVLTLGQWSLTGVWTVTGEFAVMNEVSGGISFRFHARDLNLVIAPPADGHAIRFRVKIDGAAPGADHGSDVDADGSGTVQQARMYQLVRQARPIADRIFEIEFLDVGVRTYSFTFG